MIMADGLVDVQRLVKMHVSQSTSLMTLQVPRYLSIKINMSSVQMSANHQQPAFDISSRQIKYAQRPVLDAGLRRNDTSTAGRRGRSPTFISNLFAIGSPWINTWTTSGPFLQAFPQASGQFSHSLWRHWDLLPHLLHTVFSVPNFRSVPSNPKITCLSDRQRV